MCLPVFVHANVLEDSRRALLANILTERKIPFETRSLFAGFGSFGYSIHVSLPASPEAEAKKTGLFILALPFTFSGDDQRGFPYAFEAALDFIDLVRGEGLDIDAMVAFLGNERSALQANRDASHAGLRDLYSRLELPGNTAMIYLDMCGKAGEILVHHGARRALAPLHILRPLARIFDGRKIPYALAINANELYKLGLAHGPSALEFALGRDLPALYLAEGDSAAGEVGNLGSLLFEYARSVEPGTETPDYHYLVFQVLRRFFFVSEYATTLFFLAAATLFFFAALTYSVVLRHRLAVQWKIFFRRSWILLLYWLMLMLALKGTALIFQGIAGAADPALFRENTLMFHAAVGAQLLTAASLFMVVAFLGDCIYVPRRANFYGNSAVILVIAEILLAAYIDITFIPVFIRAFVFTFLAACIRKPVLIWICALLAFVQGGAALLTIIRTGNRELGFLIFSGNTAFIAYIALVSLPFFITLKRGALLRSRKTGKQKSPGELFKQLANPKSLLRILAPRLVFFAFAAALGIGACFLARGPAAPARRETVVDDPESSAILAMDVQDRTFLERRTLSITLRAPENPLRFNLCLDSVPGGEIPVIYSAPMPFHYNDGSKSPDRSSVEFVLGEGPPNPFATEIVLPVDFAGYLRAEALYTNDTDNRQLRIIRRYPVGAH